MSRPVGLAVALTTRLQNADANRLRVAELDHRLGEFVGLAERPSRASAACAPTLLMLGLLAQALQPLLEELQPLAIEFPAMLGQIRLSQSLPIARAEGFAGRHRGTLQLRGHCRRSAPFRLPMHVSPQRIIACIMCLAPGERAPLLLRGDCSIEHKRLANLAAHTRATHQTDALPTQLVSSKLTKIQILVNFKTIFQLRERITATNSHRPGP
jgi:hypothetical protein